MLSGSSLSRNAWAIPIVRRSHTAHPGSPSKATFAMRLYGDRIDVCTANRLDKSPLRKQCNPFSYLGLTPCGGGLLKAIYIGTVLESHREH